jgi:hypothetical protein
MMKTIIRVFFAILFCSGRLAGQETSIVGAWQSRDGDDETVLICQDGYIVITKFNPVNTAFYYSSGVSYKMMKERLIAGLAFTTDKNELKLAGQKGQLLYSRSGDTLRITKVDSVKILFTRSDDGQGSLAGLWRLAGEQGEIKTLLVLSGTRFQRIRFNEQTKELVSSYGGRYDYRNGMYTEHIDFYRKNPDMIGQSLRFTVEISGSGMKISGKNEKGETVQEDWNR